MLKILSSSIHSILDGLFFDTDFISTLHFVKQRRSVHIERVLADVKRYLAYIACKFAVDCPGDF
jgi:hypothetical protein